MCIVDSTAKLQTGQKMDGMPIPRSEMFSLVGNESKKTFHANTFTLIGRTLTHRVGTSALATLLQRTQVTRAPLGLLVAYISTDEYKVTTFVNVQFNILLGSSSVSLVPWSNERPLENKELNAIIGAWFTLWRD
ncbi:hypothetical protein Tco_0631657 [Tanacetum coccineum]